ncbi:hypothetical protein EMCRGX_G014575 [Ephydatia muelleri]
MPGVVSRLVNTPNKYRTTPYTEWPSPESANQLQLLHPASLSEQDKEDFGREKDIEELQNEDEADELMLSGEQHVVQISPDVNPLEPHGAEMGGARCCMEFQFVSELQQDWA